jgi:hypothetical protein
MTTTSTNYKDYYVVFQLQDNADYRENHSARSVISPTRSPR